MPTLRKHYNGYTAKGSSGPIRLFNSLSVVKALVCDNVFDYWVETVILANVADLEDEDADDDMDVDVGD